MANPEPDMTGLDPVRTKKEARKRGARGGKASGKARREQKAMRELAQIVLNMPMNDGETVDIDEIDYSKREDVNLTVGQRALLSVARKAVDGDVKALEFLRDTAGQKPVERVEVNNDVQKAMGEISDFLSEIDDEGGK